MDPEFKVIGQKLLSSDFIRAEMKPELAATLGYIISMNLDDESGNALNFTYDSYNQLERVENGLDRYIDFSFYPNGKISQIQDNLGRQVSYTYDENFP